MTITLGATTSRGTFVAARAGRRAASSFGRLLAIGAVALATMVMTLLFAVGALSGLGSSAPPDHMPWPLSPPTAHPPSEAVR